VKWLRHAHRATHYYKSYIALANDTPPYARGAWRKKPPSWSGDTGDAKYSHAGGLFAAYLLTGDAGLLDAMRAVAEFTQATVQFRLPPYAETDGLWTERHLAAGLAAALYTYEATGDAALRARLQSIMDGMQADVDAPPAGYPSKADPDQIDKPMTVLILTYLVLLVTMVYGPIAALLVELFPTRIRYTSMSLPYHIGNGWFGGFLPTTAFAMVAATGDIYYGLWYPIVIAGLTLVCGLLFLPETFKRNIDD